MIVIRITAVAALVCICVGGPVGAAVAILAVGSLWRGLLENL